MEPLRLGFVGAGEMANFAIYPALHFAPIRLSGGLRHRRGEGESGRRRRSEPGRWYTRLPPHEGEGGSRGGGRADAPAAPPADRARRPSRPGLHVFAPKPPAPSLEATRELSELSRRTGRIVMVNFERRFSFGVTRARAIMAEPRFGGLRQLLCSFCSGPYDEVRGRDYDGPVHAYVLDFAVHHLDLARYLGGEVRKLSLFHNEREGRVALSVALEFDERGGRHAAAEQRADLVAELRPHRDHRPRGVRGARRPVVHSTLYCRAGNTFTENYSDQRSGELTGDGTALIEFVEAIRGSRQPVASIHDAVETMRLYQAIYDAVRDRRDGVLSSDAPLAFS